MQPPEFSFEQARRATIDCLYLQPVTLDLFRRWLVSRHHTYSKNAQHASTKNLGDMSRLLFSSNESIQPVYFELITNKFRSLWKKCQVTMEYQVHTEKCLWSHCHLCGYNSSLCLCERANRWANPYAPPHHHCKLRRHGGANNSPTVLYIPRFLPSPWAAHRKPHAVLIQSPKAGGSRAPAPPCCFHELRVQEEILWNN